MADISRKNASGANRIVGAASDGTESNFAEVTANGGVHANLRNSSGTEIGTDVNPVKTRVLDNIGSTVVYSGTATTTPANVPSSAGNIISGIGLDNTGSLAMQVSMDGGTTYKTIGRGEFFSWNVKGEITQIQVKTPTSTSTYEIVINFEDA